MLRKFLCFFGIHLLQNINDNNNIAGEHKCKCGKLCLKAIEWPMPKRITIMDTIQCPHCEHEYTDTDMENSHYDLWAICPNEETVDEICPNCKKSFLIRGGYIPEYVTFITEEDEEQQ